MPKLTKNDIETLKDLYEEDFQYIARDKNGKLSAFADGDIEDIQKEDDIWTCHDYYKTINKKRFKFIKWEDEKPTSIAELRKGVNNEK